MDDLISRQAAIDALYDWSNHSMTNAEAWHLRQVIGDIKSMPSAQPDREAGRWIEDSDPGEIIGEHWACSECHMCYGHMNANYLFNYCPNCGADMRGER